MNIGFYGKGGSGKTSLSSLFALYLDEKDYRVSLLDVDVNSQTSEVVGAQPSPLNSQTPILSAPNNVSVIRNFLSGTNQRVSADEFINTTPPGRGSGRWTFDDDNIITKTYGLPFGKQARVFSTGSYDDTQIGVDCHHSTQMIAENLITHVSFSAEQKDILVVDSVAGNDAFGTSLYLNDLLVFVVKPEREGISVLHRFLQLATAAGAAERVVVVANQLTSSAQREFLTREVPAEFLVGMVDTNEAVIAARLDDRPLSAELLTEQCKVVFEAILSRGKVLSAARIAGEYHYNRLIALHRKVAAEGWVCAAIRPGLDDQIDLGYISV